MLNQSKYTANQGTQPLTPDQGQPYYGNGNNSGNVNGQRAIHNALQETELPRPNGALPDNSLTRQVDREASATIEVRLSGYPIQMPDLEQIEKAGLNFVELTFLVERGGNNRKTFSLASNRKPVQTEKVLVRCHREQFAKFGRTLDPRTRLEVGGKPVAFSGPDGRPQLVIECSQLKVVASGWREWLTGRKWLALAICWAIILGGIVTLNALLPRLTPPGLLPLALLLGSIRLIEGLGFVPEGVKKVLQRYQLKILLLAAVLLAIWFFVQYSYYTTPRFR